MASDARNIPDEGPENISWNTRQTLPAGKDNKYLFDNIQNMKTLRDPPEKLHPSRKRCMCRLKQSAGRLKMSRMPHRIPGQENSNKNHVSRYDSRWTEFFVGTPCRVTRPASLDCPGCNWPATMTLPWRETGLPITDQKGKRRHWNPLHSVTVSYYLLS